MERRSGGEGEGEKEREKKAVLGEIRILNPARAPATVRHRFFFPIFLIL